MRRSHEPKAPRVGEEQRPVREYWRAVSTRCDLRFFFNNSKVKWQVNRVNAEDKNVVEESWLVPSLEIDIFTYTTVDEKNRQCLGTFGVMNVGLNGEGKINV